MRFVDADFIKLLKSHIARIQAHYGKIVDIDISNMIFTDYCEGLYSRWNGHQTIDTFLVEILE